MPRPLLPPSRALALAVALTSFQELGIGVSVSARGVLRALQLVSDTIQEFELERGAQLARWKYNEQMSARALQGGRAVLGQHAGYCDLFVPVPETSAALSVLIAGPFARERPTSGEIIERWRAIGKTRGDLADFAFSRYLAATIAAPTLEGHLFESFERLLVAFARALAAPDTGADSMAEIAAPAHELEAALAPKRMWEAARSMLDERTAHLWFTANKRDPLAQMGLHSPPQHCIVGLLRKRSDVSPIEERLRQDACQRAVTLLALEGRRFVCGKIGTRGVSLLVPKGSGTRVLPGVRDLIRQLEPVARKFGFGLHVGIAPAAAGETLAQRYGAALAAASRAFSRGVASELAQEGVAFDSETLERRRTELELGVEQRGELVARFEAYAELAAVHCGYELGALKVQLDAALGRLLYRLAESEHVSEKEIAALRAPIEQARSRDDTLEGLMVTRRDVVAEIERTLAEPSATRRSRSMQRAIDFMRQRYAEVLSLSRVARVAGFAPKHFSRLVKAEQGMTFERYLQSLRLERSKYTLTTTTFSIERVARASGFKSRTHFQQLFKLRFGETPTEHRTRTRLNSFRAAQKVR